MFCVYCIIIFVFYFQVLSVVFCFQLVCLKKGPLKRVWSVHKTDAIPSTTTAEMSTRPQMMTPYPTPTPPTLSLFHLQSRLNGSCYSIWHKKNQCSHFAYLSMDFIQPFVTPERPIISKKKQVSYSQLGLLLTFHYWSKQAEPPDNLSTFAVKIFISKWAFLLQVSAVTSTDWNYETLCPVRNQGLPLQGQFPPQTSVSPPLLLPPDSPHRINCSCRLLYLQVVDATAYSKMFIPQVILSIHIPAISFFFTTYFLVAF